MYFKIDATISMCRASVFSGDMTMISYFNIINIITVIVITDATFSRVPKIFIVSFSHYKLFAKTFFSQFTAIFTFFDSTINKL